MTDPEYLTELELQAREHYCGTPGLAEYVSILATDGVVQGLIGPREVPRLWTRHIANCAVVAEDVALVPKGARVIDVGSGAGLPGIVWSLIRPDLGVVLLEPLLRRARFLSQVVERLDLESRVEVCRGRAEDAKVAPGDVVTARAVANLGTLIGWTLPLVRVGGHLVALKGAGAADEVAGAADALARWGAGAPKVIRLSGSGQWEATTVVVVPRVKAPSGRVHQHRVKSSVEKNK